MQTRTSPTVTDREAIEALRRRLRDLARLRDDPRAYAAGVDDALDAVISLDDAPPADEGAFAPDGGWFG